MHQPNITMYQGDTMEVTVEITEIADGEERPWTPTNETVMLSVGNPGNPACGGRCGPHRTRGHQIHDA